MSLSTRLAERGLTVNGRTPTDVLAAEATRIAHETHALGRAVADTTDIVACMPARQAALQLEELAELLTGMNATEDRGRGSHAAVTPSS